LRQLDNAVRPSPDEPGDRPTIRLRRSCLAVPASSPKMLAKAATLAADQVFIDLEDAVAPSEKNDRTREQAVVALLENEWRARTLVVRVNAVDTQWCFRDVSYVVERAGPRLDCIMLPKAEDASHVHFIDHLLGQLERESGLEQRIGIEVLIENARGLVNVAEIAGASTRVEALIFGPGDYAASLGLPQLSVGISNPEYPGDQWHYPLSRIVTTARAYGVQAIDGPFGAIRNVDGFREAAQRAKLLGFDGKWVLHPGQLDACNEAFTPSQDQYEQAERLLDAYRQFTQVDGVGAAIHEGEMIDEASRRMAEAITARGRAAGLRRSVD
jgi:citrate lyase subunit beta / citryl-CoA lyase